MERRRCASLLVGCGFLAHCWVLRDHVHRGCVGFLGWPGHWLASVLWVWVVVLVVV